MRPASRGFGSRLFIRVRLRVYLPVDNGGALIGGARHLRVFISIRTLPLKQKYIAQSPAVVPCRRYSQSLQRSTFQILMR